MNGFIDKWLFNSPIGKIVAVMISIILIWLLIKFIKSRLLGNIEDHSSKHRTKKLLDFVGYFLMALMLTVVYSNKLGGLTVALGVAGAGIAFSLQEVIASVAGWLMIMFGGFYKTGDRVQLGGVKGDVIDIGVLRTTLMEVGGWVDGDLYNGRIVLIANSYVLKEPVFNYSGDFPFLWDELKLPIRYGSNYNRAKQLFEQIAKDVAGELTETSKEKWDALVNKYMVEDAQTSAMVTLVANDNWVEYTVRYVVGYKKRRVTKNELFNRLLTAVEATNGDIKFASATFELVDAPEIKVAFTNK